MRKHVNNHIGTVLILIILIVVGYLTQSGGLWLTKVYPQESEFIGVGLVGGFVAYLIYKGIFSALCIEDPRRINHQQH